MLAIMDNLSLQDSFQVNQVLLEKKGILFDSLHLPPALPKKQNKTKQK